MLLLWDVFWLVSFVEARVINLLQYFNFTEIL